MRSPATYALLICLPIFGALLLFAAWNPPGNFWGTVESPKAQCEAYDPLRLKTMTSLSSAVYDQSRLDRVIREPQNTLSNLPYVAVGLAIFLAGRHRITRSLGFACMFLGMGSGIYHASLLPEWRLVDILGVYVALLGLLGLGAAVFRESPLQNHHELQLACTIWLTGFLTGIYRNDVRIAGFKLFDSTYVVVAAITLVSGLVLLASKRIADRRRYFFFVGILVLAASLSFAGGLGDRFGGFLAAPDATIQGHSVWHACGALALLAGYEVFALTGFDRSVFSRS